MTAPKYKRKTIVINPAYQYGLAGRLAGWVVFIMVMAMLAFYLLAQNILSLTLLKYEITVEDPANLVLIHSFPSVIAYLLVVAIFTGLLALLVIRYTHRVWGPIYRFQKTVEELRQGNLALKIVLREGDSCERLATELNGMIGDYSQRLATLRAATAAAQAAAAPGTEQQLLHHHLESISTQLAFFRLAGEPCQEEQDLPEAAEKITH